MTAADEPTHDERDAEISALRAELRRAQDQQVERWLHLVRHGEVVPASIERSLSWRLTRPVRLAQTAAGVLRREGPNKFWAIVRSRLRRLVRR
ncbi:hypothetical protein [Homoserinibacter sp. YIM 151385]|uniref:hypothetical protein n=1 Tax=Homoserinibacter sp. YIM 151385 TaxID=2985506 RepID=UPI0022F055D4|nr:hypothetical protein [Homoserinibacter sp. YIM 151385]WBU37782.1 hypothetical protein OF852_12810 [Homoserinibacter sp. YIM 151385]